MLAAMNMGLINKLMSVLEASLSKLSRYDEGSFIGSILSFTVSKFYIFTMRLCINLHVNTFVNYVPNPTIAVTQKLCLTSIQEFNAFLPGRKKILDKI